MTGMTKEEFGDYWFDVVKTFLKGTRPLPRCPLIEQSTASVCFNALINQTIGYEEKYRARGIIFLTGYHKNFNKCREDDP